MNSLARPLIFAASLSVFVSPSSRKFAYMQVLPVINKDLMACSSSFTKERIALAFRCWTTFSHNHHLFCFFAYDSRGGIHFLNCVCQAAFPPDGVVIWSAKILFCYHQYRFTGSIRQHIELQPISFPLKAAHMYNARISRMFAKTASQPLSSLRVTPPQVLECATIFAEVAGYSRCRLRYTFHQCLLRSLRQGYLRKYRF